MTMLNSISAWIGKRIGLTGDSVRFWASWAGGSSWSGEPINATTAMAISAVWRAVKLTASTMATMPRGLYERDEKQTPILAGPLYDLLVLSPNSDQTPTEFWEGMFGCLELVGNAYAEKRYMGSRLVSLLPMHPQRTQPYRTQAGDLKYRHYDERGRMREMTTDEVFHLRGFSFGGDEGLSTIQFGAQSLGLSRAAEKTQAKLFSSGLSGSGFLDTGQVLNEADRTRLETIMAQYQGSDNAGRMMILEGGMKWTPISMQAKDSELLMTRGFQVDEVGRWFGMPPILLGHASDGQTMWGTGVGEILQAWYSLGLRERFKRTEDAIAGRLMTGAQRAKSYFKFNVEGLLRGNTSAQATLFSAALQNGWMTRAEVRRFMDLPFIAGTDELTVQSNLVPLEDLGQKDPAEAQLRARFRGWLGLEPVPLLEDRTQ